MATLRKLLAAGALDPAAETVLYNTGDGLKTLDAIAARHTPTVTLKPVPPRRPRRRPPRLTPPPAPRRPSITFARVLVPTHRAGGGPERAGAQT